MYPDRRRHGHGHQGQGPRRTMRPGPRRPPGRGGQGGQRQRSIRRQAHGPEYPAHGQGGQQGLPGGQPPPAHRGHQQHPRQSGQQDQGGPALMEVGALELRHVGQVEVARAQRQHVPPEPQTVRVGQGGQRRGGGRGGQPACRALPPAPGEAPPARVQAGQQGLASHQRHSQREGAVQVGPERGEGRHEEERTRPPAPSRLEQQEQPGPEGEGGELGQGGRKRRGDQQQPQGQQRRRGAGKGPEGQQFQRADGEAGQPSPGQQPDPRPAQARGQGQEDVEQPLRHHLRVTERGPGVCVPGRQALVEDVLTKCELPERVVRGLPHCDQGDDGRGGQDHRPGQIRGRPAPTRHGRASSGGPAGAQARG